MVVTAGCRLRCLGFDSRIMQLFFFTPFFFLSRSSFFFLHARSAISMLKHFSSNTIVQCRSGYVVSLATPTKAEPLYKVHTNAGPCSQFYDGGCPHLEVILEYFCLFTHNYIFLLYRVSLSEVHCKQEQQR